MSSCFSHQNDILVCFYCPTHLHLAKFALSDSSCEKPWQRCHWSIGRDIDEKVKVSSWCFINSTVWFCCSLLVSRWNIPKPTGIWGQEVTFSGPGLARTHQWKNFDQPCKKQAVPFSRWQCIKRSFGISEGETAKNSWSWKRHGTCHSLLGPAYSQDPIVEWASCSVSSDGLWDVKDLRVFFTFPPIIMWKKWVPTVVTFQNGQFPSFSEKKSVKSRNWPVTLTWLAWKLRCASLQKWRSWTCPSGYNSTWKNSIKKWCTPGVYLILTGKRDLKNSSNIPSASACSISSQKLQEGIRSPQPEKL